MKTFLVVFAFLFVLQTSIAEEFNLTSPDKHIELKLSVTDIITYSVDFDSKEIISPSTISMTLENGYTLGKQPKIKATSLQTVDEYLHPVIARKSKTVKNNYNQLKVEFKGKYHLEMRVYNDGVSYRWSTSIKDSITVMSEQAVFNFNDDHFIWFPEEEQMFSHQEREYKYIQLSEISTSRFCSTGTLVSTKSGFKVYISESDLFDYPGMFLTGTKENPFGLKAKFAGYPLEVDEKNDRSVMVTKHANYLAHTNGKRNFPWRLMVITEDDRKLIESEMVWKLAEPNKISDVSWIKPGKVAWDWWNDLNIYEVDFKSGVNTETYKYFIDFAHEYGLEYIILDEGWYHLEDVLRIKQNIDLQEILRYAQEKNVGVILWVTWKALYDKLDVALETFEKWGVKGIKVDFMQRDDQWMVNYYYEIARKSAEHHQLVDFHGAYKPTGLHRTYPNVITFEGVAGLEQNKWGKKANPEHDLILPFIRMVAGPMDYTPGAMINASEKSFNPVWSEPMSQGTRCHQLAMYVVFESPLQMLADNPTNYTNEAVCMSFLEQVPTVWDNTKVLEAKVSDYVLMARESDDKWFLGAMSDWSSRDMTVDFSFLEKGDYTIEIWQDGINADKHASDYKYSKSTISASSTLNIELASGGGWVAIVYK